MSRSARSKVCAPQGLRGWHAVEWWSLPDEIKGPMMDDLDAKFAFLFDKLAAGNTTGLVEKTIKVKEVWPALPAGLKE